MRREEKITLESRERGGVAIVFCLLFYFILVLILAGVFVFLFNESVRIHTEHTLSLSLTLLPSLSFRALCCFVSVCVQRRGACK
jgi:ABC-type phosphate transport system permease subunit